MNQKFKIASKLWEVCYPIGMYYVAITMGSFVAQMILGAGMETYMFCKIIGSLVAIPVVWTFYKQDLIFRGAYPLKMENPVVFLKNAAWVIGITACISIALNNLILMCPFVVKTDAYQQANEAFYGSTMVIELLGSALITPILEELLHRGVVYKRLRMLFGIKPALFLSAFFFAGLHFNLVQFLYAFLLGILLALFMEKSKYLYAPILAHVTANTIAVIRTETGILRATVNGSVSAWLKSIGLLLIGTGICMLFLKRNKEENFK